LFPGKKSLGTKSLGTRLSSDHATFPYRMGWDVQEKQRIVALPE